jgi:hypothetical protein
MDDSLPDESFLAFLERSCGNPRTKKPQQAKQRAIDYVSGFNAADPARVGVHGSLERCERKKRSREITPFDLRMAMKTYSPSFGNKLQAWEWRYAPLPLRNR